MNMSRAKKIKRARSPDLTEEEIVTLSKNEDWRVRQAIAQRSDLSEDLIERLSKDENVNVRWEIAQRSDLTTEFVGAQVLTNPYDDVRQLYRNRLTELKESS